MPDRFLCLAREVTKMHEEFLYGNAEKIIEAMASKKRLGEITLIRAVIKIIIALAREAIKNV